jgi:hypothetical protein
MEKVKTCSKCKKEKAISEFCSNRALPDGLCNQCKSCHNEAKRQYREKHAEEIRKKNKQYYQEHKKERKAYRETHKEKIQAYLRKYKRIKTYGEALTDEELEMVTKDRFYYARKYGYRSGLEINVANQLKENDIDPHYEEVKLPYKVEENRTYTPDFIFNNLVIETKGRFLTADRMKMLKIKAQYPDIEFRFVFTNSKARISKASQTTYARWCEKNGFKYADKLIPTEWIEEIKEILKKEG